MKQKQIILFSAIVVVMVALDQALKIYIINHFQLNGPSMQILPFFQLCYILNDGIAFGWELPNKIFLTLFRIVAVGLLGWYTHLLIHKYEARTSYIAMVALVTAGALGNIIDCVFYGKWFQGTDWFYGKVVDMLYFPLIKNGAGDCIFFRPVFNLADSCITVAVICIMIWFRNDLDESLNKNEK